MADSGVLSAEREGPHIKLTMTYPNDYDHSFMVERFDGVDDEGNDVWAPIHTGTNKFVQGNTDYELARPPETGEDYLPLPSPRTYRALVYRDAEPDSRVLILHTTGVYSDPVTV